MKKLLGMNHFFYCIQSRFKKKYNWNAIVNYACSQKHQKTKAIDSYFVIIFFFFRKFLFAFKIQAFSCIIYIYKTECVCVCVCMSLCVYVCVCVRLCVPLYRIYFLNFFRNFLTILLPGSVLVKTEFKYLL